MKKPSDVFKSIRFAKNTRPGANRNTGQQHIGGSTDDEEHYTVGTVEFQQQLNHAKRRAMQEEPTGEEYMKEYDTALKKSLGKIKNPKIAKGYQDSVVNEQQVVDGRFVSAPAKKPVKNKMIVSPRIRNEETEKKACIVREAWKSAKQKMKEQDEYDDSQDDTNSADKYPKSKKKDQFQAAPELQSDFVKTP